MEAGVTIRVVRDAGTFARAVLSDADGEVDIDLVFDAVADVDGPEALAKDGSIDPGVLAWLLAEFPVEPLPQMLEPLPHGELTVFRDALAERLRRLVVPQSPD